MLSLFPLPCLSWIRSSLKEIQAIKDKRAQNALVVRKLKLIIAYTLWRVVVRRCMLGKLIGNQRRYAMNI